MPQRTRFYSDVGEEGHAYGPAILDLRRSLGVAGAGAGASHEGGAAEGCESSDTAGRAAVLAAWRLSPASARFKPERFGVRGGVYAWGQAGEELAAQQRLWGGA